MKRPNVAMKLLWLSLNHPSQIQNYEWQSAYAVCTWPDRIYRCKPGPYKLECCANVLKSAFAVSVDLLNSRNVIALELVLGPSVTPLWLKLNQQVHFAQKWIMSSKRIMFGFVPYNNCKGVMCHWTSCTSVHIPFAADLLNNPLLNRCVTVQIWTYFTSTFNSC